MLTKTMNIYIFGKRIAFHFVQGTRKHQHLICSFIMFGLKIFGVLCVKVLLTSIIKLCILQAFYIQNAINFKVNHYDNQNNTKKQTPENVQTKTPSSKNAFYLVLKIKPEANTLLKVVDYSAGHFGCYCSNFLI